MSDSITVVGTVATEPRHVTTEEQLEVTTFRLASAQRRYDRKQQKWVDGGTNWYTIVAFRQLASNAAHSIHKGDRVIAHGRPRVRDWASEDRSGTTMEVEVDGLGHDLLWGRTAYTRTAVARPAEQEADAANAGAADGEHEGETSAAGTPEAGGGSEAPAPARELEPSAAF